MNDVERAAQYRRKRATAQHYGAAISAVRTSVGQTVRKESHDWGDAVEHITQRIVDDVMGHLVAFGLIGEQE